MPDKVSRREIRRLHGLGLSDGRIAAAVGCSRRWVTTLRRALGLARNRRWPAWSKAELNRVVRLIERDGYTVKDVADELGLPYMVVTMRLRAAGFAGISPYTTFEGRSAHVAARYAAKKAMVWALADVGLSVKEISERVGCGKWFVRKHSRDRPTESRRWAHQKSESAER